MIKEKEITINGHSSNYKYYQSLGYDVKVRKPFSVKPKHLMKGSVVKVTTICDNCSKESSNVFKDYYNYTDGFTEPYYCKSCKVIKSKETSLKKWGVDNPMKSDEVKESLKNSLIEKYGVDHYSKTDEYRIKFKETCLNRYNVDNPYKSEDIKKKIKETTLKNTGYEHASKSPENKKNIKDKRQRLTWTKYGELIGDSYNILKYDTEVFDINHKECGSTFSISKSLVHSRHLMNKTICTNCNPVGVQYSSIESEIRIILDKLNIDYESNNRTILGGLELDFYIPEYKLAIEVNGLYWHSEHFKETKYHLNKTLECRERGIQLLHFWEDDWNHKRDILKSILYSKLNLLKNKIWVRKCVIKNVLPSEAKSFLNENHIQGYSSSTYKIGLFHNEELVSLMTFGWRWTNGKREFELIRFCNKIGYLVIGSASKLFKNFINTCDGKINTIISYSDISIFTGDIYKKLGFTKISLSKPNYFWVVNGKRRHRYNYSKKKLVNKGHDPNKTGTEIMYEMGYWRVFSCGQEKWIYKITQPCNQEI